MVQIRNFKTRHLSVLSIFAAGILFQSSQQASDLFSITQNRGEEGEATGKEQVEYGDKEVQDDSAHAQVHLVKKNRFEDLIKKSNGTNWTLWDRETVLFDDFGLKCNWSDYKPAHPDVRSAPMCLYPRARDAAVSGTILDIGRWPDCDSLTPLLRDSSPKNGRGRIHLEIGANIGSCIMQVLLTTDATIFAFEPHPLNLFHLTSTLNNLDESYRRRVFLFPIALGAEPGSSNMVINAKNAGNAQVGRVGRTGNTMIRIERLDDVLNFDTTVNLMKMDAQGYECFILQGMPRTLSKVQKIAFEVEHRSMTRFGSDCTPDLLVALVKKAGLDIQRLQIEGKDDNDPTDLPDFTTFKGSLDLLGVNRVNNSLL